MILIFGTLTFPLEKFLPFWGARAVVYLCQCNHDLPMLLIVLAVQRIELSERVKKSLTVSHRSHRVLVRTCVLNGLYWTFGYYSLEICSSPTALDQRSHRSMCELG